MYRRFESQSLRIIANAPWFASNTLQRDLVIPTITDDISKFSSRYQAKINIHQNPLVINLFDNSETTYRLKRHHVLDLTFRFSQED
ncbi:RNA-directed DNA polymerase from mobile element jockey [Blattella germanica]|nr:RNA-directed DNA polymerase from mobile element jockey [Blattella germanica]